MYIVRAHIGIISICSCLVDYSIGSLRERGGREGGREGGRDGRGGREGWKGREEGREGVREGGSEGGKGREGSEKDVVEGETKWQCL